MKVVFISSGSENLGIEYLSSALKLAGHRVELVFDPSIFSGRYFLENSYLDKLLSQIEDIVAETIELKPDLVAMSVYTSNFKWSVEVVRELKKRCSVPVIFGGDHVTSLPELVLEYDEIDFICVGEGEQPIVDLADNLEAGDKEFVINGIWFKRNGIIHKSPVVPFNSDLDSYPFPDKTLFKKAIPVFEEDYSLVAGRGCMYKCPYCSHSMYHRYYRGNGKYARYRSVDNVIQELKMQACNAKTVCFEEGNFMLQTRWLEEFAERYPHEIAKPFSINIRPHVINDRRASLLSEAGCKLAYMGIQNGSEELRKSLLHRNETNDMIRKSVKALKEHGIKISIDHIFGLPGETLEMQIDSLRLYADLKPDRIIGNWLMYYPRTEIIDIAKRFSLIDNDFEEQVNHGLVQGSRNTGGAFLDNSRVYLKFQTLMYLIPIISQKAVLYFLESERYKKLPASFFILKILLLLNAMKMKDWLILRYIKFVVTGTLFGIKKRLKFSGWIFEKN